MQTTTVITRVLANSNYIDVCLIAWCCYIYMYVHMGKDFTAAGSSNTRAGVDLLVLGPVVDHVIETTTTTTTATAGA